jgi:hypothetical protein
MLASKASASRRMGSNPISGTLDPMRLKHLYRTQIYWNPRSEHQRNQPHCRRVAGRP